MNVIREAAQFVKQLRKRLKRGARSSEPLTVLRFEWRGDCVECDWLIRPIDADGRRLPARERRERQTAQAFQDALELRELIFDSFSAVMRAQLRMYSADRHHSLELMMAGTVERMDQQQQQGIPAAVRARMLGLKFNLSEGILEGPLMSPLSEGIARES